MIFGLVGLWSLFLLSSFSSDGRFIVGFIYFQSFSSKCRLRWSALGSVALLLSSYDVVFVGLLSASSVDCHFRRLLIGCSRFVKLCWVGNNLNIIMKPSNSPTQGQPNPTQEKLS